MSGVPGTVGGFPVCSPEIFTKSHNHIYLAGTNVTFTVSTGDGDTEHVFETFTDGFEQSSIRHRYESAGVYEVSINARNDVEADGKNVKCTVYVEDPIANLSLAIPPLRIKNNSQDMYIAVGEIISVEGNITRGTSVSCDFDFGEDVLHGYVAEVFSKTYKYQQPGNYIFSLNCTNRVSNMYRKHSKRIVVQEDETITNLRIVVDVTRKGKHSVFTLMMRTGTAFVCDWTLGDNTAFQTDVSDIEASIYHQYAEEGAYDTNVRCNNRHGIVVAASVAWVQIPIADLTCNSLQRYLIMSEEASFNISVQSGSHVTVVAEFENDQRQSVALQEGFLNWTSFILKHFYTSIGSFVVTVNASNLLGDLSTQCRPIVIVQNPLLNITLTSNMTIMKVSENVIFSIRMSVPSHSLPTNASCSWTFGDNSSVHGMPLIFKHGETVILHRYLSPGKFVIYVSCSNEVSRIGLNTTVTVLKLIKPSMKVCLNCNHSTDILGISYRRYFTLGDKVMFVVTSQDFDLTYHWEMTKYGSLEITKKPFHIVTLTKTGVFTASVLVDKVVETMSASVEFIVQEKIYGVALTSSGFTWLRSTTRFEFTAPKFEYGSCFIATLNDSLNANVSQCSANSTSNYAFSFNHTYLFEGNYSVCLTVFNKVSEEKRCLVVEVSKPVCRIENVSIWDSDVEAIVSDNLQSLKYKKSQQFQLQGHYINKCLLPTSKDVSMMWMVKKLTSSQSNEHRTEIVRESTGYLITVNARSLQDGEYYFVFMVEFTSPDVRTLYGRVEGEATIQVEMIRSPLVGSIAGEKERYIYWDETLTIDASFHDPDLPPGKDQTGMRFTWYCMTLSDTQAQHFVHCYDDELSHDNFITIITNPIFSTSLNRYVANKTYIFTVRVEKDDRPSLTDNVTVGILPPPPPPPPTPPPPPEMKIRCVQ